MAAAITPATKLLLPVHIAGTPADLDALTALAQSRGLTLLDRAGLEDFSLSHVGARAELRALLAGLNLPGWDTAKLAA